MIERFKLYRLYLVKKVKTYSIIISLSISLISSGLILPFYRLIFPCNDRWYVWVLVGYAFLAFPLSLYRLLKLFKIDYSATFWTVVATLIFFIFSFHESNRIALEEIKNNGGIGIIAIITDKYSSVKSGASIDIKYETDKCEIKAEYNISRDIYNKLKIGDTILIVYALRCPEWNLPFNYFPSRMDKEKYLDGKIISKF